MGNVSGRLEYPRWGSAWSVHGLSAGSEAEEDQDERGQRERRPHGQGPNHASNRSSADHWASSIAPPKRGLQDKQYIGPV